MFVCLCSTNNTLFLYEILHIYSILYCILSYVHPKKKQISVKVIHIHFEIAFFLDKEFYGAQSKNPATGCGVEVPFGRWTRQVESLFVGSSIRIFTSGMMSTGCLKYFFLHKKL